MSAKDCLKGKIALGKVSKIAGAKIIAIVRDAEKRAGENPGGLQSAMEQAYTIAAHEATRREAIAAGNIVAQASILDAAGAYKARVAELRKTPGDFGFGNKAPPGLGSEQSSLMPAMRSMIARDPWDIASDLPNVYTLARQLRGEAQGAFAEAIEYLRPKGLGLKHETAREFDVLGALFGRDAAPEAKAAAQAFGEIAERQRQAFNKAAGYEAIPERADWRIGNPRMNQSKVQAWAPEAFAERVAGLVDRRRMIDFETLQPMSEAKLQQVLREVHETGRTGGVDGEANAGFVGQGPLAARRSAQRTLMLKDAEAWTEFNELFGDGEGVFDTMMRHFSGMAHDTAILKVFGPDPAASKRFILSMFDREAAALGKTGDPADPKSMTKAVRANIKSRAEISADRWQFESLWAHMTGEASIPANAEVARIMGDARAWLASIQLGSAMLSAIADTWSMAAAARFNGLPVAATLGHIVEGLASKNVELNGAQLGVVADTLAHASGHADLYMGETIRAGRAQQAAGAVIRASGLRRWTGVVRSVFGMEMTGLWAKHAEAGTAFEALPFRAALERYGIDAAEWGEIAKTPAYEMREGAKFLRPEDVRATPGLERAGEKLARMLQTELDFTAIETDPVAKALLYGQSKAGTLTGEAWRAATIYKSYPVTVMTTHGMRAFARGWDGSRLAHGAFAFTMATLAGALAMQTKEIAAGRDPLSLDASKPEGVQAWIKAMQVGGGLGLFGDLAFADKTKFGDSWAATLAGPIADTGERVLGGWLLRNLRLAAQGKETSFFGDALYIGARYVPGSSLWYGKLAFQRAISDQLLLQMDPKAPERFSRIEQRAQQEFHQSYWWRPAQTQPERAPDLSTVGGR